MKEINKINLSEQTKYRLCEIIGTENYFHQEINQRKLCIKKLKKTRYSLRLHRQDFNCFKRNKLWIIYNFFYKHCESTSWNGKSMLYSIFFFNNKNNQKITKPIKETKRKSMIKILCWLKVNSIALKL